MYICLKEKNYVYGQLLFVFVLPSNSLYQVEYKVAISEMSALADNLQSLNHC